MDRAAKASSPAAAAVAEAAFGAIDWSDDEAG